jgi:hypothetical protein
LIKRADASFNLKKEEADWGGNTNILLDLDEKIGIFFIILGF